MKTDKYTHKEQGGTFFLFGSGYYAKVHSSCVILQSCYTDRQDDYIIVTRDYFYENYVLCNRPYQNYFTEEEIEILGVTPYKYATDGPIPPPIKHMSEFNMWDYEWNHQHYKLALGTKSTFHLYTPTFITNVKDLL